MRKRSDRTLLGKMHRLKGACLNIYDEAPIRRKRWDRRNIVRSRETTSLIWRKPTSSLRRTKARLVKEGAGIR